MLDAGASMSWTTQHAIREPSDFDVVGHIYSHLKIEPNFAGYLARCQEVGEQGRRGRLALRAGHPDRGGRAEAQEQVDLGDDRGRSAIAGRPGRDKRLESAAETRLGRREVGRDGR